MCDYDVDLLFRTQPHLVWNLACGFAQNESQLLGFRFLAGLGNSAPLAVCNQFQSYIFRLIVSL